MGTILTLHNPSFSEHAIFEPAIQATWYQFVKLGERLSCTTIDVDAEHYLTLVLARFMNDAGLFTIVLALELLKASTEYTGHKKEKALNDVGDASLIIGGLYPERHKALSVSKSYFLEMGRIAFGSLAINYKRRHLPAKAKLYEKVEDELPSMINVLQAAREHQGVAY